ncbi:hypothetical protein SDRG_11110 [Saprolegnia diclina VS20]|uniref:Uncharacterized protein n=1 Tax=Saprolegnia diclina (strain VS20) TaxID=1156394 RepID=T0QC95_SAPDV|nr:hypothetical protein SDRG_11110 [Saprolegnia diclina VS20]EQC31185.1 hypothetical protein SDRG_11110 [Saprolegnia diclina VS20]|eukprot:XP_008615358.1 hypothetical protein SDRG_11110 [Saprolegnia diclina VS20]
MSEHHTGPVLADWSDVAAWKRGFLDAAATRGLHKYYTVHDYEDPVTISHARRVEIHAAAENTVPPVPPTLPSAAFRDAVLARAHAVVAHVADATRAEAAKLQARTTAAAVAFLLAALSPHLRDELDSSLAPYALWADVHAKGYVLMDNCRFFGLLENVRLADDDELPHGLAHVEQHIQRFVDVIFVPSHGSDARLLAAADRLKMALLCNACPPEMTDVFETWRADEPVWDYASMRRRLVEHWTSPRLGSRAEATSPATVAHAMATDAASRPLSAFAILVRAVGDSQDLMGDPPDVARPATSTKQSRRAKRAMDATSHGECASEGSHRQHKRPKTTPKDDASARSRRASPLARGRQQEKTPTRMSPREHVGALRTLTKPAKASRSLVINTGNRYSKEEVAFLRAHSGTSDTYKSIYNRGRAQGLFKSRPLRLIKCKLSRLKAAASAIASTSDDEVSAV